MPIINKSSDKIDTLRAGMKQQQQPQRPQQTWRLKNKNRKKIII